jgi:hypothetical protein
MWRPEKRRQCGLRGRDDRCCPRHFVWREPLRCAGRCGCYYGLPVAGSSRDAGLADSCERLAGRERVSARSKKRGAWVVAALLYRVHCCGNVLSGGASCCSLASVSHCFRCPVRYCSLSCHEPDCSATLKTAEEACHAKGCFDPADHPYGDRGPVYFFFGSAFPELSGCDVKARG